MALHLLILAGGSGTRLWPLSRTAVPKHLLPLGPGGISLLRATAQRVLPIADAVHVVTAANQRRLCERELTGLDVDVIAEPDARGTGPALGLAVRTVAATDPEAIIASVHADAHVGDDDAYRAAVLAAAGWAQATEGLVTVGLTPPYPSTGMGYIALDHPQGPGGWEPPTTRRSLETELVGAARVLPAHAAAGFVEKPARDVAEGFLRDGRHLWNLGLFAWPVGVFAEEFGAADAALWEALEQVVTLRAAGDEAAAAATYAGVTNQAIEPLVFERTRRLTAVQAAFPWSDLGSWPDLHAARAAAGDADPGGNVIDGDALAIDARGCTISSRGRRLVAVVGAQDLVVIDTADAVLVLPAGDAQRVKQVVEELRRRGRDDLL